MAKSTSPVNSNINRNNNNVNVKVDLHHPKKSITKKKTKPNWLLRAIVIAIIGFVLSLIAYYIKTSMNENHDPAVIENGTSAINGEKVN